ncbi:YafY family protein [Legionella anisa]|uniref:YafY family transcriptional regulator n=1 Tax=Legionella anisa TaxID=28082 RepID=A0AAX0WV12_9GAMM|nr:YafY family protein [Legionella anisa]AWN74279.1 YafY family transcriptional regulator [Legionella anisa]KTC72042.1 transcriptional regulator [Legionella anisa]MBN5934275.1 YafY family transcriptional regulator [Legionella anisa]MCW8425685.1 YafY family transcriptional regulator [Legionella anisa]MCW8448886.1 YafY family transcriptional regulator [Legionella anisa]
MSRTERLLDLIQLLRRHRFPVSGVSLAQELGISLRTLYRDISTLKGQGAPIEGEAGMGYVLRSGFTLPPLMFTADEIEAIVLGSRWVADRTDTQLKSAAQNALAKIAAVLPNELREQLEISGLLIAPGHIAESKDSDLILIRKAIRLEKKLQLTYQDVNENASQRMIWPLALGFFDQVRILITWCELRQDFRHFRTDRIIELNLTETNYPERRQTLLKKWKALTINKPH